MFQIQREILIDVKRQRKREKSPAIPIIFTIYEHEWKLKNSKTPLMEEFIIDS